MATTYTVHQPAELPAVAAQIRKALQWPVCLFKGAMGVGKTTLIQHLCKHWQVQDAVQSPTFQLVNEYVTAGGVSIYHFDFYRLRHYQEALDMGLEEYLDSGRYCLIEWPEKITQLWPNDFHLLEMQREPDGSRIIILKTTSHE